MVIGILTLAVDGSAVTFGTAKRGLGGSLKQLHWLPVPYRLQFKIATLMHMVYHRHCPQYLVNMVSFMSDAAGGRLRSTETRAAGSVRTRTNLGRRAFTVVCVEQLRPTVITKTQTIINNFVDR